MSHNETVQLHGFMFADSQVCNIVVLFRTVHQEYGIFR